MKTTNPTLEDTEYADRIVAYAKYENQIFVVLLTLSVLAVATQRFLYNGNDFLDQLVSVLLAAITIASLISAVTLPWILLRVLKKVTEPWRQPYTLGTVSECIPFTDGLNKRRSMTIDFKLAPSLEPTRLAILEAEAFLNSFFQHNRVVVDYLGEHPKTGHT